MAASPNVHTHSHVWLVGLLGLAAAVSDQFFGSPLAVIASGHEQPVSIFQQLA